MTEIIVALITALIPGLLSLLGVVITNHKAAKATAAKIETCQAVTDYKIEELTREVREHNGFARRMPVVEEQIGELHRQVDEIKREIRK